MEKSRKQVTPPDTLTDNPHIPDEELDLVTMPEIEDFSRGVRGPYLQSVKILRERRAKERESASIELGRQHPTRGK
jgi:hypothetical protein